MSRPRGDVVLIAGRDPGDELSGGHSSYVRAHARAALAAGFCPHLFCAGRGAAATVETDFGVVHRLPAPLRPVRQLAIAVHGPRLAAAIERFAAAGGGRLVLHGFGVWGYAGVLAARRLRRRGVEAIPLVSSYTTYEEEARSMLGGLAAYGRRARWRYRAAHAWIRLAVEPYERRAYCGSQRVLLNYESVRRLIAAKYGSAPRCAKLPYASEAAFVRAVAPRDLPGAARRGSPLVVAVARHEARKGLDVLLAALARLLAAGVPVRACLIGGGPLLEEHRRLARRLGLAERVTLPGPVEDCYSYLEQADLFVLPSRAEQSGSLALLEALQAGCAVVASGVDGILEDVEDGESALLVPPGDSAALAAALGRALGDAGLRRHLARGGRGVFRQRFSAERFSAALAAVYAEAGVVP